MHTYKGKHIHTNAVPRRYSTITHTTSRSSWQASTSYPSPTNSAGGKGKHVSKKAAPKKKRGNKAVAQEVDKDFKEAEAGPNLEAQATMQSQMLEALFEIYFRCVRAAGSNGRWSWQEVMGQ